jgi:two-component system, cell cycle sensor histidine kinase and response regulator CckA
VLGEHISIHWDRSTALHWVEGDVTMIEQVIMNLCVNARDAMPKGGELALTTELQEVKASYNHQNQSIRAGKFICLTVKDTGSGMDAATVKRIFEPFFTTKEVGKGTGLGLATVYGIVKQHHGWVEVESSPGSGTTFKVYFPEAPEPKTKPKPSPEAGGDFRGRGETILLVEDDQDLRSQIALNLREKGYKILEAGTGLEAVRLWEQHNGFIDLLFTDMVMPGGLTGLDVVERLRQLKPKLKVIVSSGYSLDLVHPDGKADASIRFLPKPYPPVALTRMLRESLDAAKAPIVAR